MTDPPYRLIYVGLACAIIAQLLVIATMIGAGRGYLIAGNVAAAVFSGLAWWLIRQRQKGRI